MRFNCKLHWCVFTLFLLAGSVHGASEIPEDISLEDLLKVQVISTPKFALNAEFTPSSVSVLTRQEIRTYGWRTLADALRTLNGFTATNDHTYGLVGTRGVSAPSDYRTRLQVLIDGIPTNENIYGSASFDSAFPLDIDLIEQIEVVRGPSASVYGGDSTFGVINVITRSGGSLGGTEVSVARGSGKSSEGRVTWGTFTEGGTDIVLSYSGAYSSGHRLNFPDMANAGLDSVAYGVEGTQAGKFFARVRSDNWRATLLHSQRDEIVPNGSYATVFNDDRHREADSYTLAEVANDHRLNRENTLHTRLYAGKYTYKGDFPYDYPPYVLNQDRIYGQWWGFESRLLNTARQGQRWTAGVEYKANTRQDQKNEDAGYGCYGVSATVCLDDQRKSRQFSFYAQDEITVGDSTYLTLGLRHDRQSEMPGHWNPRLGLVHQNDSGGTFKFLYATAFSDPTVYQRFYATPTFSVANPNLVPERMRSIELSWEQRVGARTRLTSSLFFYRIQDLLGIDVSTGLSANLPDVLGRGVELELQHRWLNGAALRVGYTLQQPSTVSTYIENVARHSLRGNLSVPIFSTQWLAGLEGQLLSRRQTGDNGNWVAGYGVANANFTYQPSGKDWHVALGVYNLFDHQYNDPSGLDTSLAGTRAQTPQFGRTFRLKFTAHF
ncbi:MAG: hypothetical protein RLZZ298_628 [Pseudomonadota bacterium]|jgi:iron complex outermembrane receptor protein